MNLFITFQTIKTNLIKKNLQQIADTQLEKFKVKVSI